MCWHVRLLMELFQRIGMSKNDDREKPRNDVPAKRTPEEQELIDHLERTKKRPMTEQEKNFAIKQARAIGEL